MSLERNPMAGATDDPRALQLAKARHERIIYHAPYGEVPPPWDELSDPQRATSIAEAAQWLRDAALARLIEHEYEPAPSSDQLEALEQFLFARTQEIQDSEHESAMRGTIAAAPIWGAAVKWRDRVRTDLHLVRFALDGIPHMDVTPHWDPRAQQAWASVLEYAKTYHAHEDYRPETWTTPAPDGAAADVADGA